MFKKKPIYLDYASATPLDAKVLGYMMPYLKSNFANGSAIHKMGVEVRSKIEASRNAVAQLLGAHKDEIFFTGSATESNAMAVIGAVKNFQEKVHIITTTLEHPSVIENCKMLEKEGKAEVSYIAPEDNGIIDPKKIRDVLREDTVLVSVIYASNEIGTIQPIQEIAKAIRQFKKGKNARLPFFHSDATQAMNYLFTENVEKLGVDMLTFNGSKIYGPKGVGILYKKRAVDLMPVYAGGGQENDLRSGTENVAGIVGIAEALKIANGMKEKESVRLRALQEYFFDMIGSVEKETDFKIKINGDRESRLPNNMNITVEGISSELLVIELDAKGFEVSQKSACKAGEEDEDNFLRITTGRNTMKSDLELFSKVLADILKKYRKVL